MCKNTWCARRSSAQHAVLPHSHKCCALAGGRPWGGGFWTLFLTFSHLEFDHDFVSFSGCSLAPFWARKAAQNGEMLSKIRHRSRAENRAGKCLRPDPSERGFSCILCRRGIENRGPHCVRKCREKGSPRPPFCLLKCPRMAHGSAPRHGREKYTKSS